jgi:hypothetical protein
MRSVVVKKVVVLSVLCAGALLQGMELAHLHPNNHSINEIGEQVEERKVNRSARYEEAYQQLPDGAQAIEVKEIFTPAVLLSLEHQSQLRAFEPQMVSDAFMALENDPDYRALKAACHGTSRQNDSESKVLERSVAVKLFYRLARKEVQITADMRGEACCRECPWIAFHIVGMVMLAAGPGISYLERWLRCS